MNDTTLTATYRYFLAHSKADDDRDIDRWASEVTRLLETTHGAGTVQVVPGRDDFRDRAEGLGGWKPWQESVATGVDWRGAAVFDGIVIPIRHQSDAIGRATSDMADAALAAGKPVYACETAGSYAGTFYIVAATVACGEGKQKWTEWATLRMAPTEEPQTEPQTKPQETPPEPPHTASGDWQDFVSDCDSLIRMCEDVPERGADFASSVQERVEGMRQWAEENRHVTEKMEAALTRMTDGVAKWMPRP